MFFHVLGQVSNPFFFFHFELNLSYLVGESSGFLLTLSPIAWLAMYFKKIWESKQVKYGHALCHPSVFVTTFLDQLTQVKVKLIQSWAAPHINRLRYKWCLFWKVVSQSQEFLLFKDWDLIWIHFKIRGRVTEGRENLFLTGLIAKFLFIAELSLLSLGKSNSCATIQCILHYPLNKIKWKSTKECTNKPRNKPKKKNPDN